MGERHNADAKTAGHKLLMSIIDKPGMPESTVTAAVRGLAALELKMMQLKLARYKARQTKLRDRERELKRTKWGL